METFGYMYHQNTNNVLLYCVTHDCNTRGNTIELWTSK